MRIDFPFINRLAEQFEVKARISVGGVDAASHDPKILRKLMDLQIGCATRKILT
jgi:hypothetical protein